ncbi:MAG: endonuclease III domain-containing protein [Candidatus Omnitrophica bacterium]|nr:endonuclease III domain-containing protein [Candidatus Omnitrophota bacterium]
MKRTLRAIYRRLFAVFGAQHWWPGETPFEVAVGAILTQNTAWANASKAVERLKAGHLLDPRKLERLPRRKLAGLIRSSGYFNQKAKKLKGFIRYLNRHYGGALGRMRGLPLNGLRVELLALHGVGPETADSILLYALEKPIFVVDAYTRRFMARHGWVSWKASYEEIQSLFMENLPHKASYFNEYHALIVALGKNLCRTHPKCHRCPLKNLGKLSLETSPASNL